MDTVRIYHRPGRGPLFARRRSPPEPRLVIFSSAINIGSVLGPMLCGTLAQVYGWHRGFGIAAIFMIVGLITYLSGYRHLPAKVARGPGAAETLTSADRRRVAALAAVMALTIFQSIAYSQIFNVNPIRIQRHVAPTVLGFEVPIPWYQASNSFFAILGVPLVLGIWQWQARRGAAASRAT